MTDPGSVDRDHIDDAGETAPSARAADRRRTLVDQLGGLSGVVYTTLPIVAFVAANVLFTLPVAIAVAVGVAALITGWRLLRKEPIRPALSGLLGVAAAAGVAAWTGSAGGFFLIGIWGSLGAALLTGVSVLVRRPLTGFVWNALHGGRHRWRRSRPVLRAHDMATLALTAVFASRFLVQRWLYDAEATGWLAFAKVVMGIPLLALALLVVIWAFRRSTRQLTATPSGA
ncbi:DUF3159 domain-containing protein [Streptosporangium sp. V21-05]|uniref:DUF3159 domain-containing protein n=1 Tax=Streptosporangium sp. V21-05 TaxID=3446115 RepID=UPI003F53645E